AHGYGLGLEKPIAAITERSVQTYVVSVISISRIDDPHSCMPVHRICNIDAAFRVDKLLLDVRAFDGKRNLRVERFRLIKVKVDQLDLIGRIAGCQPDLRRKPSKTCLQRNKMA